MPGINANIGYNQGGDEMVLGGYTAQQTVHHWQQIQRALVAQGGGDYVGFFDDFLGDALADKWDTDIEGAGSIAPTTGSNGVLAVTTDATSGDRATLALSTSFKPDGGPVVFEARVAVPVDANAKTIEIGLSDSVSETAGQAFSSHDATAVGVAADAVVFAINEGESVDDWKALAVAGGGTPQGVESTIAPAATYSVFRVELHPTGLLCDARFYVDGVLVAEITDAATTAVNYTPWLSVVTGSANAVEFNVDYVFIRAPRA